MDGVYPTTYCPQQPIGCCANGQTNSYTGGTWVSNAFIRNRGQTSFATQVYDEGWPDYLTNNPPPTPLYVRVAPSMQDPSKQVFWINGWERPRLLLTCGKKYQINVVTCGYPFFFTTDPVGGNGNKGNISSVVPADFYVSTYTMEAGKVPKEFYYQSSTVPGMGGKVQIVK